MNELPSSWGWSTIGELADYIQRGKSPKYADHSDLPVVNQKCIRWNRLEQQHLKFIHPDQIAAWDGARYIRPGDVLWNSTGTGTVGRAHLVKAGDCDPPKVVDSHVTIVRPGSGIEPRYLFNWIRSPAVQDKIEEMCDGTTNQIELSRAAVAVTAIPVAPQEEQTRIADQLDTLLARIQACQDRLDAIPALLKRFRQAVVSAGVVGGLTDNLNVDHQPGECPLVELQSLCAKGRVITYGVVKLGEDFPGGTPCLRTSNVRWLRFENEGIKCIAPELSAQYERTILEGSEVLVNVRGTLGGVAVASPEMEGWNVSREVAVIPVDVNRINPDYLALWVASAESQRWLARMEKGVAYVGINIEDLRRLPTRLPSRVAQDAIVATVQSLLRVADRIEASHAAATAQALRLTPLTLAKAFRGELVPQDANDEPASTLLQRLAQAQAGAAKPKAERGRHGRKKPRATDATPAQLDWATLPAGAWALDAPADEHAAVAALTAVLKAWGQPMPQDQARLATALCLQPRLFTGALPAAQADQWCRLVGAAAQPLPTQVARLQVDVNTAWGITVRKMRTRGDLLESGQGQNGSWSLAPSALGVDTTGWPEGRAAWVVSHLRAHGMAALLPALTPEVLGFIHARAA